MLLQGGSIQCMPSFSGKKIQNDPIKIEGGVEFKKSGIPWISGGI